MPIPRCAVPARDGAKAQIIIAGKIDQHRPIAQQTPRALRHRGAQDAPLSALVYAIQRGGKQVF
jgi:hypothetical protein